MSEDVSEEDYLKELQQLARVLLDAATRAEALDGEEKPDSLVGSLDLGEAVEDVYGAWREVDTLVRGVELQLAASGIPLEDRDQHELGY